MSHFGTLRTSIRNIPQTISLSLTDSGLVSLLLTDLSPRASASMERRGLDDFQPTQEEATLRRGEAAGPPRTDLLLQGLKALFFELQLLLHAGQVPLQLVHLEGRRKKTNCHFLQLKPTFKDPPP